MHAFAPPLHLPLRTPLCSHTIAGDSLWLRFSSPSPRAQEHTLRRLAERKRKSLQLARTGIRTTTITVYTTTALMHTQAMRAQNTSRTTASVSQNLYVHAIHPRALANPCINFAYAFAALRARMCIAELHANTFSAQTPQTCMSMVSA